MADLATRLEASYCGAIFDALLERGFERCVLPMEITPLDLDRVMAGPAVTVRGSDKVGLSASDSLLAWTELLSLAPRNSVVVIASGGVERALMGELSSETLQFHGVRGVVTDRGCRDCAFIRRIGFPVFFSGMSRSRRVIISSEISMVSCASRRGDGRSAAGDGDEEPRAQIDPGWH
jgi:4-hydroxy-4-methyl-2-oxoglutarate aldolase